mmetsp:Transcript_10434/g.18810  ORF Transcript_10434/g.18810 Transcript_10434/m.18810 type:complete len:100 (+) Transcript_10434:1418-1717(+)
MFQILSNQNYECLFNCTNQNGLFESLIQSQVVSYNPQFYWLRATMDAFDWFIAARMTSCDSLARSARGFPGSKVCVHSEFIDGFMITLSTIQFWSSITF